MNRINSALLAAALALALAGCGSSHPATPASASMSKCLDPEVETLDASCLVQGVAASVVRTACDVSWIPGACDAVSFESPNYAVDTDPHPDAPFMLAIGVVHEHSSYSDGDPILIPRDYFAAGRNGHNTSDDGEDIGLKIDFLISAEHSDNEKLPVTTSASCIPFGAELTKSLTKAASAPSGDALSQLLACQHLGDIDHYFKWQATLQQANDSSETEASTEGLRYTGFTGMRGFEWTNDFYNHMSVYFSTNVVNAKIDGSYAGMNFLYGWLREPIANGGGADGLAVFNHPGKKPALTPFDGGLPHNDILALTGGANWNDLAYVASVDDQVIGIEINGNDDLEWYVKALSRGWHLGPFGPEDEHQRDWSSAGKAKTVLLTRGRSPQDYYFAMKNRRSQALRPAALSGAPGEHAQFPKVLFTANDAPLGSIIASDLPQDLRIEITELAAGSRVYLISSDSGLAAPLALGVTDAQGAFSGSHTANAPASGESWFFVLICPADETECGSNDNYLAVTAPIWLRAASPQS